MIALVFLLLSVQVSFGSDISSTQEPTNLVSQAPFLPPETEELRERAKRYWKDVFKFLIVYQKEREKPQTRATKEAALEARNHIRESLEVIEKTYGGLYDQAMAHEGRVEAFKNVERWIVEDLQTELDSIPSYFRDAVSDVIFDSFIVYWVRYGSTSRERLRNITHMTHLAVPLMGVGIASAGFFLLKGHPIFSEICGAALSKPAHFLATTFAALTPLFLLLAYDLNPANHLPKYGDEMLHHQIWKRVQE